MKKLMVVFLALLVAGCGNKEKLYKGKPASYWAKDLDDPDVKTRHEAATALAAIGRDGRDFVPDLIKVLKDKDAGVRGKAAEVAENWSPRLRYRAMDASDDQVVTVRRAADWFLKNYPKL